LSSTGKASMSVRISNYTYPISINTSFYTFLYTEHGLYLILG
jgi:hypothetical protein